MMQRAQPRPTYRVAWLPSAAISAAPAIVASFVAFSPNGQNGINGAWTIAAISILLSIFLELSARAGLGWAWRVVGSMVPILAGSILVVSYLGRAPWLVSVVFVIVTSESLRPALTTNACFAPLCFGMPWLLCSSIVWSATQDLLVTVLLVGLSAVSLVLFYYEPCIYCRLADRILRQTRKACAYLAGRTWTSDPDFQRHAWTAVAAVIASTLSYPVFYRMATDANARIFGFNDYPIHLKLASDFTWAPLRVSAPHPIFHGSASAFRSILGGDLGVVAALMAATAALVVSISLLAHDASGPKGSQALWWPAVLGFTVVVMESPVALLNSLGILTPQSPFAFLHPWSSPTDTVALPLTFLLVRSMIRFRSRPNRGVMTPDGYAVSLLITTVLATLAKPAVALTLLPGYALMCLTSRSRRSRWLFEFLIWSGLPAFFIMLWQFWFLKTDAAAAVAGFGDYGFTWEPFRFLPLMGFGPGSSWKWLWFSGMWIIVAFWAGGRKFISNSLVKLALASLLASLPAALLLGEKGVHAADGNLLKPMFFAWNVTVVMSVIDLAPRVYGALINKRRTQRQPRWVAVAVILAAASVAGGIAVYLDASRLALQDSTYPAVCVACQG